MADLQRIASQSAKSTMIYLTFYSLPICKAASPKISGINRLGEHHGI
jgi:hypothetical protein